jgi:tachykinin-like receptor
MVWPDGNPAESLMDHIYQIVFFLVTYVVPMVGLSVTYCHLGSVLWSDQDTQTDRVRNRRKVGGGGEPHRAAQLAKMFIVVLIVFGVCWLPYHAYFLFTYYHTEARSYPGTQHIFLAFFWLAMANSAINPVIYFHMDAK